MVILCHWKDNATIYRRQKHACISVIMGQGTSEELKWLAHPQCATVKESLSAERKVVDGASREWNIATEEVAPQHSAESSVDRFLST